MSSSSSRVTAPEAPRPLTAGEIGRRLDLLRDEMSGAADAARSGAPHPIAPAELLRRLASLTSRN